MLGRHRLGRNPPARGPHGRDRPLQDAGGQTAPAGMHRRHPGPPIVAHEHRQTIRRHDDADHAGLAGDGPVGLAEAEHPRIARDRRILAREPAAMHLPEPQRLARQFQALAQDGAIPGNPFGRVPDMIPQVEACIDAGADTAVAGGRVGPHPGRCGPIRLDHLRRDHLGFGQVRHDRVHAAVSPRNCSSNPARSAGNGISQLIAVPSVGCSRPRRKACSA